MWEDIVAGIRAEFASLDDFKQFTQLTIRALFAGLLGGAIGLERERRGKDAGVRTLALVCLGTALFVAIPQLSHYPPEALSRIIQGITAGVGFLGAGAIIKHADQERIEGLTTAASIWLTSAIGVAIGIGSEVFALLGTVLALVILRVIPRLEKEHSSK